MKKYITFIFLIFCSISFLLGQNLNSPDFRNLLKSSAPVDDTEEVGIIKYTITQDISVHPIPADKELTIEYNGTKINCIRLVDITGKLVYEKKDGLDGNMRIKMNIDKLSAGIFFLQIELIDKQVSRRIQILHKQ